MNVFKGVIAYIRYYKNPKYVVMKGCRVDNRQVMFIGSHPTVIVNDYGVKIIKFKNVKGDYYFNNIYKRVWTFKELLQWRRKIGSQKVVGWGVLELREGKWEKIIKEGDSDE